ncbi:hypothetical protein PSACC_03615 [Paramicrosporidium saccamoebae]|uniref:Mif2 N-terminal domain-containing protein n=1 Tax=Paramicrosporidium saccamoebae TaxID=1246581 RepID=A0A2H9TFQ8_9FUNG|nr:hypothetical protein PSACC_03615 [Paramicrosporidium saccamoebae]
MRRTSLFNRRFATLSRKEALVRTAPKDEEGFDDLDNYFAASPRRPETRTWSVEDVDVDRENVMTDDDNEVTFRPTMKLVKSSSPKSKSSPRGGVRSSPRIKSSLRSELGLEASIQGEPDYMEDMMPQDLPGPATDSEPEPIREEPRIVAAKKRTVKKKAPRRNEAVILYDDNGRKSKRQKIEPLKYWKNERVVYGRRLSSRVPVIVDVVRGGEDTPIKATTRGRSRGRKRQTTEKLSTAGFKSKVSVEAKIMDYDSHRECEKRKKMVNG